MQPDFVDVPTGRPGRFRRVPAAEAPKPPGACRHLGTLIDRRDCEVCGGGKNLPVYTCAVHGQCSPEGRLVYREDGRAVEPKSCQVCRIQSRAGRGGGGYEPVTPAESPRFRFRWISTAKLVQDSIKLAGMLPADCSGVVGVPRSGMIPASVIATHLHLPLYTLAGGRVERCLVPASRGNGVRGGGGPLAVVDDTTFSGLAMRRTRAAVGPSARYYAVYVNSLRPESKSAVDGYAEELPAPHLLEWNWANNGPMSGRWADVPAYGRGIAIDLDGIVVHDAASGGRPGTPYMVPRALPCPLICTGRPESSRGETEATLRGLGVRWQSLKMLPAGLDPADAGQIAAHKAENYAASGCGLFLESDPTQAEMIFRATGKPVCCPAASRVWD